MSVANYAVGIQLNTSTGNVFKVGTSTVGGPDVIGDAFSFGNTVFNDVSTLTRSVRVTRGRLADLSPIQQGSCTIVLSDPAGTYNPDNPSSPYAAFLYPMRQLRVYATFNGTNYGIFRGFISRIEHNPDPRGAETTFEAVDFFEILNVARPVILATGQTTTGAAIGTVLTACGWTDPLYRSLDTGDIIPNFSADGTKTAMQLVSDLLAAELGVLFVDAGGVLTYRQRNRRYVLGAVVATLNSATIGGGRPSTDLRQVVNGQTVTRTGGVAQTSTDATSRSLAFFGPRDGSPISTPYINTDGQALSLASFLVMVKKQPQPPARAILLMNKDDATLTHQLAREIGDWITVVEPTGQRTGTIEGLDHQITDGGRVHRTSFTVAKRTINMATLGRSTLGGPDPLGY